jgi:TonB-dependent receptor
MLPFSFVIAQDEAEEEVEEVIVTGVKQALIDALEIKRNNVGVTEIVTAEDIGKFPDGNLAESLARLPGVAIDRSNVEGSTVSIRGLGPEYNMVTLNGRTMPTAPALYNGGRAFDFGAISSHGTSRLEVYKSNQAILPSGGLGATVNMVTTKPLESPGTKGAASILYRGETSFEEYGNNENDEFTPEAELVFSTTGLLMFGENQLQYGYAFSGSYHDRSNTEETTNEITYIPVQYEGADEGLGYAIGSVTGGSNNGYAFVPQSYYLRYKNNNRLRKNLQNTFQLGSDNWTLTVDNTFSSVRFNTTGSSWGSWLNLPYSSTGAFADGALASGMTSATINANGTFESFTITEKAPFGNELDQGESYTSNRSIGANLEYVVNDVLTLEFDHHESYASVVTEDIKLTFQNGSWPGYGDGQPADNGNPYEQHAWVHSLTYTAADIPTLDYTFCQTFQSACTTDAEFYDMALQANDIGSRNVLAFNNFRLNDTRQDKFVAVFDLINSNNALKKVTFGLSEIEQVFTRDKYENELAAPLTNGGGTDVSIWGPQNIADDLFVVFDITQLMDDQSAGGGGMTSVLTPTSFADAAAAIESGYWAAGWDASCTSVRCFGEVDEELLVTETTRSIFAQFEFEGEYNNMPWDLIAGLRYEDTILDTPESYYAPSTTEISQFSWWEGDGPYFIVTYDNLIESEMTNIENNLYPSLAFSIGLNDDVVLRASYSKSAARAGLESYSPNISFQQFPNVYDYSNTASRGNPNLGNQETENFDLALEYYYKEGSYAAVNVFRKNISGFIESRNVPMTFDGVYDVRIGLNGRGPAETEAAIQYYGNGYEEWRTLDTFEFMSIDWWNTLRQLYILYTNTAWTENPYLVDMTTTCNTDAYPDYFPVNNTCVVGTENLNPLMQFNVLTTDNSGEGVLEGVELALQHFIGDTDFGFSANLTMLDTDSEQDPGCITCGFSLPGFGDAANLSIFYDNGKFSARISDNFRDETYAGMDQFNPLYIEARHQVDVSMTYTVDDSFAVFFEALNVTEENVRLYSRYEEALFLAQDHGAVYALGLRYKF